MKTLFTLTKIMILAFLLQTCTDDDNPAALEKVQFTFDLRPLQADGGRVATDLPEGVSLMISLQNISGETVLDHHRIELLKVGDNYISQPLDLVPGRYKLIDFMIVNTSNEVLYATPRAGSPFATAVVHALPYSFNVSKDKIKNIPMEVVDVSQSEPEDFGYASFNVSVVEGNPFRVSVFVPDSNQMVLASAQAFIIMNGDTLSTHSLKATINTIFFTGDTTQTFTLVVMKEGYIPFKHDYTYQDLMDKPLSVTLLKPSGTFKYSVDVAYIESFDGGLYPGAFELHDYALIDITVVNGVVSGTPVINQPQWGGEVTYGECNSFISNPSSNGALNIVGATGYVDYTGNSPIANVNLEHYDVSAPEFFILCGSEEPRIIWTPNPVPAISSFSFDVLGLEHQTYTTPNGLVTVDVWRIE